jgi:predicted RNA binding protein YcfA (HicA-like mRNA interferase family)
MPKKYPPLEARDVIAVLRELGFQYSHSEGGHDFYKGTHSGKNWKVTVDPKASPFGDFLLKSMISQAGVSRDQFYGATKNTASKAGLKFSKTEQATATKPAPVVDQPNPKRKP